jgi:hypothetical protein
MDKDTIQQIAAEVVARLPDTGYAWLPLVVQTLLMLLVAGGAAILGPYLMIRGKQLATKHDFDAIQDQLKATTVAVETIKSEVSQRDWAQREWMNLRRTKLEALLETMHDCEAFQDQLSHRAIEGNYEAGKRDPMGPFVAIGALYFPELANEIYHFSQKWRELVIMGMNHAVAVQELRVGADLDAFRTAQNTYREQRLPVYKELIAARDELTAVARRLLVSIMGMDEHP